MRGDGQVVRRKIARPLDWTGLNVLGVDNRRYGVARMRMSTGCMPCNSSFNQNISGRDAYADDYEDLPYGGGYSAMGM
jgi:hypothetical protein